MSALALSDYVSPGGTYTFTFSLSAYGVPVSKGDIQNAIANGVPILDQVNVKESVLGAAGGTFAGGQWDVTFVFNGPGNMQVADVASLISQAVASTHWLVSFDFVTAAGGSEGQVTTPEDFLSSVKKYGVYILVALGLIVAFQVVSTVKEVA